MKKVLENELINARDIGGYKTVDGFKRIKYNKLIRSNVPSNLSEEACQYLLKNNIKIAIDLRNDIEIAEKEAVFKRDNRFHYYHCKINGDGKLPATSNDVPYSYIEMVDGTDMIYSIFKIILESKDSGIIYFCNAGKDRTGIITALIMMLLGIDDNEIINEYMLTADYLKEMLEEVIKNNESLKDIVVPKKEFMEKFIELFNNKYVSIEEYMKLIGFSSSQINKIRKKLIE